MFCSVFILLPINAQRSDTVMVSLVKAQKIKLLKPVLFGTQDSESMLQSYSSVDGERLLHRPVFHIGSTLYGVLPGLRVSLASGLPSAQVSFSLRGNHPLFIVDGIPRSSVNLSPDQIESVSVIKDALGLSMLGMMAGDGVIQIVTKRGVNDKLHVNFTAQLAVNKQIYKPKFLGAYDYSNLFSEALTNNGQAPIYSKNDLEKYKSGANPYTHPNMNWYDYLQNDRAQVQQYNLNFRGGGKIARYFLDLNYYDQGGFLKEDKSINTYSTKDDFKKYSLRSNIDIDLTPTTLFSVNAFGQMLKENTPGSTMSGIYTDLSQTPNNAYPAINPNGSLGGNRIYQDNLYGQTIYAGYNTYNASDLNLDVRLTQKFTGVLTGAYASALYSYNSIYRESLSRTKNRAVFDYKEDDNGLGSYNQLTNASQQANVSTYNRQNRMMYGEVDLGYDFVSGKNTSKNKVVYLYNNYLIENYLPFKNSAISGRFEYDYSKRYFAEIVWSYMSMNQFKPGKRGGFFPALGLGWNLAEETWFNKKVPFINKLKLRGTYGLTGDNLAASYFDTSFGTVPYYYDYLSYYVSSSSAYFSSTAAGNSTVIENQLPYPTTWTKIRKLNIGVDVVAFDNKLQFTAEFFNNNLTDVLQGRGTNNSGIIGVPLPQENLGKQRISGFEFDLGYSQKHRGFEWSVEGNATLYKTKEVFMDETSRPYSYMRRTGQPIGQLFGYQADGVFQSQEEIDEYLSHTKIEGYIPKPGDLKYKDLNGDHVIDDQDVTAIGTTKPLIVFGLYGTINWKGIGFNMQWEGVANRDVLLIDMPFEQSASGAYGQASESHLNRWSPNNPNADYPRFTVGGNSYNEASSSFWVRNGNYLRLKHVELSYDLPSKWISSVKLSGVKIFTTGYNLLTIAAIKDRDPELINYSNIPNTKSFNFGINIQF